MKYSLNLLALPALVAALPFTASAQPYYVTGSAMVPAWTPGTATYELVGGPTVYSLTTATVANAYHEFKITGASWSDPNWPADNVQVKGDAYGTNTFYFYPGLYTDGWAPVQNRVGYEDPGMGWEIAGDLNGWSGGAGYQLNSLGGGLFSNSIVVPVAGSWNLKFRTVGAWDASIGTDFSKSSGNISLTTTQANQLVKFQLDVRHGCWVVGDLAPSPVTNQVVFAVDMPLEGLLNQFDPAADHAYVSGAFNNWPGIGAGALVLTNDPAWNGNTNIYYATNTMIALPGANYEYKFTSSNPNVGSGGYEPISQNRKFTLMTTNGTLVLPVVLFGNAYLSDYLTADTTVTFTLNMTNAVAFTNGTTLNDAHAFDPEADAVYVNGNFLSGGWVSTWNGASLNSYRLVNYPVGSQIYQFTTVVPKGSPVRIQYKYAMNYAAVTNSLDNEAAAYSDHVRFLRMTASGSYEFPMDTFGNQHVEPEFALMAAGPAAAGKVPVTWLGRPGVLLQTAPNLTGGAWQSLTETDGTNWTAGYWGADGLVSQTNWPAAGNAFFRLLKPN